MLLVRKFKNIFRSAQQGIRVQSSTLLLNCARGNSKVPLVRKWEKKYNQECLYSTHLETLQSFLKHEQAFLLVKTQAINSLAITSESKKMKVCQSLRSSEEKVCKEWPLRQG